MDLTQALFISRRLLQQTTELLVLVHCHPSRWRGLGTLLGGHGSATPTDDPNVLAFQDNILRSTTTKPPGSVLFFFLGAACPVLWWLWSEVQVASYGGFHGKVGRILPKWKAEGWTYERMVAKWFLRPSWDDELFEMAQGRRMQAYLEEVRDHLAWILQGFLGRMKFMMDPDVLPVDGFRRTLAVWRGWRAWIHFAVGFLQLVGAAISAWGFLLEVDSWACEGTGCILGLSGVITRSFRLNGSLFGSDVLLGPAWCGKRCNITWLHTALGFGTIWCLSDMCDLWNPSWRDGGWLQFLHGYAVMVCHSWLCNGGDSTYRKGVWTDDTHAMSDMDEVMDFCMFCSMTCMFSGYGGFLQVFVAMRRIRLWICFCNFGLFLLELMTLKISAVLDVFTSTVVFVWFWSWWNRCLKRQVEFVENMSMRMPKFRFHGEKSRL